VCGLDGASPGAAPAEHTAMNTHLPQLRRPLFVLSLAIALAHCASARDPSPIVRDSGLDVRGGASAPATGSNDPDVDPAHDPALASDAAAARDGGLAGLGSAYVASRRCAWCHQGSGARDIALGGGDAPVAGTMIYGPNLTPDYETGLGRWTDAQLIGAVRTGIDDQGAELCWVMPRFADMGDAEAAAIVAYLRSLTAVARVTPEGVCPPAPDEGAADEGAGDAADAQQGCDGDADAALDTPLDASLDGSLAASPSPDAASDARADVLVAGDAPCAPALRINEVQTAGGGGAADEFVEIYNGSPCAAALANWELRHASATGAPVRRWLGAAGDVIPAHGYAVVAGAGFSGPRVGTFGSATGVLATTAGGLGLFDPRGTQVDSVGYGLSATNALVEAAPAPAPPSGWSIIRAPDGHDTNDNSADFVAASLPTPNAPNR
jgi:hypothetical protein